MMKWVVTACMALGATIAPAAPPPADRTPRTAIVSAFPPEWVTLKRAVAHPVTRSINGTEFVTGTIAGKPVLLFLSGVSMVNAAMTTQLALDRFTVRRIVFSGVAGGIDPKLDVGDVVVADRWAQYLESAFGRKTATGYNPPSRDDGAAQIAGYGMIFPRTIGVSREGEGHQRKTWFDADPALVALARKVAPTVALKRCSGTLCLKAQPRLVVGGNGISGPVFMDNAEFRDYLFKAYDAQVLDMESAAVAQVAYVNRVPYVAFRALSDLAGGDPGDNQANAFYPLASDISAGAVLAFVRALPS